MRSWILYGRSDGQWRPLDSVEASDALRDGLWHEFVITDVGMPMDAVRLCQTGRNGSGSPQMHLGGFRLTGTVFGPPEFLLENGSIMETKKRDRRVEPAGAERERADRIALALEEPKKDTHVEHTVSSPAASGNIENTTESGTAALQSIINPAPPAPPNPPVPAAPALDPTPPTTDTPARSAEGPQGTPGPDKPQATTDTSALSAEGLQVTAGSPQDGPNKPQLTPAPTPTPVSTQTPANVVIIDEKSWVPTGVRVAPPNVPAITDIAGIEEVRTLSSSRFGAVRLMRRATEGGFEYFAGKFYNAGDSREGLHAFQDRVRGLVSLSHPSIMPIVGVVPPTKTAGPIFLTPYSPLGSLADVLNLVRANNPPEIWTEATKLRMIISLISGFMYLHSQGVVHRELKPSDLIVQQDGSILICGYVTSVLEEYKWTRASQIGAPSYMAPEVYEDRENEQKSRDPKTDVFAFGLILYEILTTQRVFPPSSSAAVIMRRAMSAKPGDRPVIPAPVHGALKELITKSWLAAPSKRLRFEDMWAKLQTARFQVFSTVEVLLQSGT